jgi:hypothetical protein
MGDSTNLTGVLQEHLNRLQDKIEARMREAAY